jgi:ribonuclease VapC
VRLETSIVLATKLDLSPEQASALFDKFLAEADPSVVPINDRIGALAVLCFQTYCKGRHAARLDLGDCPFYACAKAHRAPLLFKGVIFASRSGVGRPIGSKAPRPL